MVINVGNSDRIVRLIAGAALIAAPFVSNAAVLQSTPATVAATVVGGVLIITSAVRFCPLYRIFGIRTCKV